MLKYTQSEMVLAQLLRIWRWARPCPVMRLQPPPNFPAQLSFSLAHTTLTISKYLLGVEAEDGEVWKSIVFKDRIYVSFQLLHHRFNFAEFK
jgi:hypothetical protein